MIGLGQEDEIEEITLWPEIWRHDAVCHEADHCMKLPHSANVCIFWFRLAKGAVVLWTSCWIMLWQLRWNKVNVNKMSTLLKLCPTNTDDIVLTFPLATDVSKHFIGWGCVHTCCHCREQFKVGHYDVNSCESRSFHINIYYGCFILIFKQAHMN